MCVCKDIEYKKYICYTAQKLFPSTAIKKIEEGPLLPINYVRLTEIYT